MIKKQKQRDGNIVEMQWMNIRRKQSERMSTYPNERYKNERSCDGNATYSPIKNGINNV